MSDDNAVLGIAINGYSGFRLLGRGGFSSVYQARQDAYDRAVAVKVLDDGIDDEAVRRRFHRECLTTGRLTGHPNIVTILESGFLPDGRPYLAMPLCSGGSLSERLDRERVLPVADVLRIGVRIAGALQTAHNHGIVHRDIKPENILLTAFGEPALADFGISIVASQQSSTKRTQAYTPSHAPPEVLCGELATEAADIYNLGSTLYQLLAGYPPFRHSGSVGLATFVHRVLNEAPPRLARPDAPPSLESVLFTAMAKRSTDRYPTAEAMGAALRRVQSELGLRVDEMSIARPDGSAPVAPGEPTHHIGSDWDTPTKTPRRRGSLIAAVTAAVVALGGGAAALTIALSGDETGHATQSGSDKPAVTTDGDSADGDGMVVNGSVSTTPGQPDYNGPTECGELSAGEALYPQDRLGSCSGGFELILQGDGNLVLMQRDHVVWHAGTTDQGGVKAEMREDGDFVLEDSDGDEVWSTGTGGHAGAWLAVQDDGNLIIYHEGGDEILWKAGE